MADVCMFCLRQETGLHANHLCSLHLNPRQMKTHNFNATAAETDLSAVKSRISGHTTYRVNDFNPSCRKVSFDCVLDPTDALVHVFARCKIEFVTGPAGVAWNSTRKTEAKLAIFNSTRFWNRNATLVHTATNNTVTNYAVRFYIDDSYWWNWRFKIRVQTGVAPMAVNGVVAMQCNALVPTGTGYANALNPGAGTAHIHDMQLARYSPYCFPADTTQNNGVVMNAAAHEFGHMIGLPDEYIAVPNAWPANGSNPDKASYLWRRLLVQENIAVPAAGPNYNGLTIMNKIECQPRGFLARHYVTILEAVRHISGQNQAVAGTWVVQ